MPTCPSGHHTYAGDFCDVCGAQVGDPAAAAESRPDSAARRSAAPRIPDNVAHPFGGAGTRGASGRSAGLGPAATSAAWAAVVTADRDYCDGVIAAGGPDAASIEFPPSCPERRFQLTGRQMRIGRHSASREMKPEIDLTGPPTDPGISHLHAILIAQPDGTWAILDPGSSNGTQLNGREVSTGVPYPLHPGDRICLGAWTVLTITA